jgi:hypothetical protein
MATATKKANAAAKKGIPITPAVKRFCSLPKRAPRVLDSAITGERARLIRVNETKWANGTVLSYYFYNRASDGMDVEYEDGSKEWVGWKGTAAQMKQVRKAFDIWANTGMGLKFKEVKKREEAQLRIAFMMDDGSWSYIGRDILDIKWDDEDPRTMNFGWNIATSDKHDGIDTAVHEIGHTLGFPHEHQNPFAGIVWDQEAVYRSLAKKPNYWSRNKTYQNIIKKISKKEVNGSDWDPDSIMHYPFEPGLILEPKEYKTSGLYPAGGLSPRDVAYALKFYPSSNQTADKRIMAMISYEIEADNSSQQNFIFIPSETRNYTIQTLGQLDTVMVVSEKKTGGQLVQAGADDNSGTNNNALLNKVLTKGKTYIIRIKVYYKKPGAKAAIMVS